MSEAGVEQRVQQTTEALSRLETRSIKEQRRKRIMLFAFLTTIIVALGVALGVIIYEQDQGRQRGLHLENQSVNLQAQIRDLIASHSTELTDIKDLTNETNQVVKFVATSTAGPQAQASLAFDLWIIQTMQAQCHAIPGCVTPPLPKILEQEIKVLEKQVNG